MNSSVALTMANNGSYSNDRTSAATDIEFATDPASGSFFNSDYKKHEDLKQMLDVNKDSLKLEAMKRIIGMIAKGRDASDLFPAVVKNVVSKNIEVKKISLCVPCSLRRRTTGSSTAVNINIPEGSKGPKPAD